ncbi:hypothetical protein P1P75_05525 [Streptomyces sp. ID05-39B]|uniref:hypothetical protein n=1 Tax=Streptomyces sp. ID05-39B TaxID=3028664 RepID=UPI0029A90910|nr:hypothetical protein [Streptomyces sp. ID05-39B]MDX3525906.1 hypothetical protein [Streptomyces sp. ID05-39B]
MAMPPPLRKVALTAHVAFSVGWLGAVAGFLALAIAGLTSSDAQVVRGAYVAMEVIGWFVLVPFSLASLLTGLIQALGTTWGLVRHYWVLFKFLISVVATVLLLVHMEVAGHVADAAAASSLSGGDLKGMRIQLLADAGAALLVLLVAVALSVYKPRGLTRYGWHRQREQAQQRGGTQPTPVS